MALVGNEEATGGVRPQFVNAYRPLGTPQGSVRGGYTGRQTPIYTGDDIYRTMANDRLNSINIGDRFNEDFGGQAQDRFNLENQYRQGADTAYEDLYGTPGYTSEEAGQIYNPQAYYGGMTTPDEYASNYLSQDEQGAIAGNPYAARDVFNANDLDVRDREGAARQREQFGQANQGGQDTLRNYRALNENALGTTKDQALGSISGTTDATRGAVGDTANYLGKNVSDTSARLQGAVDPSKLGVSDAQVALMKDQAGRAIGAQYGSARDETTRRALAEGGANPLNISAALDRLNRSEATGTADAINDAELKGIEAQRNANKDIAGMNIDIGKFSGQQGQEAGMYSGAQRLANEQAMGEARTGAIQRAGENELQANLAQEGMGLNFGEAMGRTGIGMEGGIAGQTANTGQYLTGTNTGLTQYGEAQGANRAQTLAGNRQSTNQYNQGNRYNQAFNTQNALSNQAANVANARRAGQQEYRGYQTGQQQYQGGQGMGANQLRMQGVLGGNAQALQSSGQQGQYDLGKRSTGFTGNLMGSLGRTVGGGAGYLGRG